MNYVVHTIPKSPTVRDYFTRLWVALTNQAEEIIFDKQDIRTLYKQAYPKAKV